MQAVRRASILIVLLALAGCGGGGADEGGSAGDGGTTAAQPTTTGSSTGVLTVKVPNTADPNAEASGSPVFKAGLTATAHSVAAGSPFAFTVTATKGGEPAPGTAKMRVFVDDELVNTIGWFAFEGRLVKSYVWPRSLKGKTAVLQAEVEGEGGTQRVNWPVEVS
jgi:hypothetical protein